jgi:hypothetical protein
MPRGARHGILRRYRAPVAAECMSDSVRAVCSEERGCVGSQHHDAVIDLEHCDFG